MKRLLAMALLVGCTDETPYVLIDEPHDLTTSDGAVYRLQDITSCGDAGFDGEGDAFQRVSVDNRADVPLLAFTWDVDPCVPFDNGRVDPGEVLDLAFLPGGTLRISTEELEPLHTWLTVGAGTVVVR